MGFKLFAFIALAALLFAVFYEWDTFNYKSIRGKRVLITGASSGIGEELAYQYSKLGAAVVITARKKELLYKVASKCTVLGAQRVEYVVADMAHPEDRQNVVRFTEKQLGGIDHLILNHGTYDMGLWFGTPENITRLHQRLEIDFISYVDIASKCLKILTESKGNIGIISSMSGKMPTAMLSTHSTTKYAFHGFFEALRQELRFKGNGVSVTMCVLGYIATDATMELVKGVLEKGKTLLTSPAALNETVTAIIQAVDKREREICFPKLVWYFITAYKLVPQYVDQYIASIFFDIPKFAYNLV